MRVYKDTIALIICSLVGLAFGVPNPLPLPDPNPNPNPQSSTEEEPPRTDLCDPLTYDGFFDRFLACENKANAIIFETYLAGGDLWDGICASIKEVVDVCVPTIGPECWSDQELTNVKYNVIKNHFRKANNDTSLGRAFIDSCPTLYKNENEMVKQVTGSSKCSFNQYESSRETLNLCQSDIIDRRDKAMAILDFSQDLNLKRSFFTRILCTVQDLWQNTCTKNYLQCLGPEIQADVLKNEKELVDIWTSQITDFEPGFTFEKDCEGLYLPNF